MTFGNFVRMAVWLILLILIISDTGSWWLALYLTFVFIALQASEFMFDMQEKKLNDAESRIELLQIRFRNLENASQRHIDQLNKRIKVLERMGQK